MDDRRFDSLVRALAGNAPRRSLLRALAGGAGAALLAAARRSSPASAHHGSLGAGAPCYDSSQCVAADAPLVCADNGFDYDGPLNCCTYVGSRCFSDEGCCGALVCVDGSCHDPSSMGAASLGDACTYDGDCSQDYPELGALICADNGFGYEVCCRQEGGLRRPGERERERLVVLRPAHLQRRPLRTGLADDPDGGERDDAGDDRRGLGLRSIEGVARRRTIQEKRS